jgi:cardiolipin synthase
MARLLTRVALAAPALGLLGAVQFVFNPLGLGPEAELLVDGEEAFGRVYALLEGAQRSIHVQTYIWKDDDTGRAIVERLKAAADRGVEVVVSKDMLGTSFEAWELLAGKPSPVFTEAGLAGYPGIEVRTDWLADTDHSKYFIVDGHTVVFGGMNIADEYHPEWHDYMGVLTSPARVERFERRVLRGEALDPAPSRVAVNDASATEIRRGLVEIIDRARSRVIVEHAYISDDRVIDAMLRAGERGVRVDLVVPAAPDTHGAANKVTINRLLAGEGVNVWLYPVMSHAKVVLVDGRIVALGSANLTPRSMLTSREVTWFAHAPIGADFVTRLAAQLEDDIRESRRCEAPFELSASEGAMAVVDKYVW